jgi:hypothetical protein
MRELRERSVGRVRTALQSEAPHGARRVAGQRRTVRLVVLANTLVLASAGCDSDPATPPTLSVEVTVCRLATSGSTGGACDVTSILPLGGLEVRVTVRPAGAAAVDRIEVEATGAVEYASTFIAARPSREMTVVTDTIWIPPVVGTARIDARASGPNVQATAVPVTIAIADDTPPSLEATVADPWREPGDTVTIIVVASDNAAIAYLAATSVTGPSMTDTLFVGAPTFSGEFRLPVPDTAPFGSVLQLEVAAVDFGGNRTAVSPEPVTVVDLTAPVVEGSVFTGSRSEPLVPGDTLRARISATDRHSVRWLGYRIGSPVLAQDSFPVSGVEAVRDLAAVALPGWVGIHPLVLFARDSTGNLGEHSVGGQPYHFELRVVDAVRRTTRSAAGRGAIQAIAYDAPRDRLLLLHSIDISVLALATLEHGTPIELPGTEGTRASGMALSPDGDRLVVSLGPYRRQLGVVELGAATLSVDTVPLTYPSEQGWPNRLAVTSRNTALVGLFSGFGTAWLVEVDLVDGAQQRRQDAGHGGDISSHTALVPAGDGSSVALIWGPQGGEVGQLYDTATDAFGMTVELGTRVAVENDATRSVTGHLLLAEGRLFDGALFPVTTFAYPSSPDFPESAVVSALAPAGDFAYFAQVLSETDFVVVRKVRLTDNALIESILIPDRVRALRVVHKGELLVVDAWTQLLVVSLD